MCTSRLSFEFQGWHIMLAGFIRQDGIVKGAYPVTALHSSRMMAGRREPEQLLFAVEHRPLPECTYTLYV